METYQVLAYTDVEGIAKELQSRDAKRFCFHPSKFEKFADSGMDKIEVDSFFFLEVSIFFYIKNHFSNYSPPPTGMYFY